MRQTQNFVILGPFTFPSPLMIPKIKILKKKKCLEILSFYAYMCTINEDHMIYGYWNIRCNRQKFLSFWVFFLSFQVLDSLENQNFKIWKNTWRYHFTHLHHKWQSCDVLFLSVTDIIFLILDRFFPFYSPENQNFKKSQKTPEDIFIL